MADWPEYPSLGAFEITAGNKVRLARSQRKYIAEGGTTPTSEPWLSDCIGEFGEFDHASTSAINDWLRGWQMPSDGLSGSDAQTSFSIFVGLLESEDMPEISSLRDGTPFIKLTSHFVRMCSNLADVFPVFATMINGDTDAHTAYRARGSVADYVELAIVAHPDIVDFVARTRDRIFTARTTAAAVRWAIAHEMAHAVSSKKERRRAYEHALSIWPDLEKEQWNSKRARLTDFEDSVVDYRDEIGCDMLANQYVFASPFSADDLITQASGSLLALEALRWDGLFADQSAISETHPSPTLRYRLIWRDWLDRLVNSETWIDREAPGPQGLLDFAYWYAFEQWASGAYGPHRNGAVWHEDIKLIHGILLSYGNPIAEDQVYMLTSEGIFRATDR